MYFDGGLRVSTNPCPCGFYTDPKRECRCTPVRIQRYFQKISGPLLDRIDIHLEVPAVPYRELAADLEAAADISAEHVYEAIQYRTLDRQLVL